MSVKFSAILGETLYELNLRYKISYIRGDSGSGKSPLTSICLNPQQYLVSSSDEVVLTNYTLYKSKTIGNHDKTFVVIMDESELESIRADQNTLNTLSEDIRLPFNTYWVFILRDSTKFLETSIHAVYKFVSTQSTQYYVPQLPYGFSQVNSVSTIKTRSTRILQPVWSPCVYDSSMEFHNFVTEDSGSGRIFFSRLFGEAIPMNGKSHVSEYLHYSDTFFAIDNAALSNYIEELSVISQSNYIWDFDSFEDFVLNSLSRIPLSWDHPDAVRYHLTRERYLEYKIKEYIPAYSKSSNARWLTKDIFTKMAHNFYKLFPNFYLKF